VYFGVRDYIKKASDKIVGELMKGPAGPNPPDEDLIACAKRCVAAALAEFGVIDWLKANDITPDPAVQRLRTCLRKCWGWPS
jgi:hypothetical protein